MGDFELAVPFVVCASQGGPFDDDAFVAGYEMGQLATELSYFSKPIEKPIHTANTYQADLLAMDRGWTMTTLPMADDAPDEWKFVRFTPPGYDA
jgi:hypothetical protein